MHTPFDARRYCTPTLDESNAETVNILERTVDSLPFDRILGVAGNSQPSILYADITSEAFRRFHKTVSQTAKDGKTSYRIRYKPSKLIRNEPLTVSGYGVELALKRTDYIVIDDRQAEEQGGKAQTESTTLSEEDVSDLRPLSSSELLRLGLKAASFVLSSEDPLEMLLRLTQDFPKHSSSFATANVSKDFIAEHSANRETVLPPGFNALWINGVQIVPRDVDAYALLEHLRRERKMINSVRELGLSGPQAVELLTHEAITASQAENSVQRFDWRDDLEGSNVIIWLNDIEKDKRYAEWSRSVSSLFQRTYPGQLPLVRRNVHNLVIPLDFSDSADVYTMVENIQSFVKRRVPIRFGVVPVLKTAAAAQQAKVVYHLLEVYGLAAALDYLETSLKGSGRKHSGPVEHYFAKSTGVRRVRREKTALTLREVIETEYLADRLKSTQRYIVRLGLSTSAPIFVNGVAIEKSEEWIQIMSQRVGMDARIVQQYLHEQTWTEDIYLPDIFLRGATGVRNTLVIPEDEKDVRHINVGDLAFAELPSLPAQADTIESELVHLTVVADLDSEDGLLLALQAWSFQQDHRDNMELAFLHVPRPSAEASDSVQLLSHMETDSAAHLLENVSQQINDEIRRQVDLGKEESWSDAYQVLAALSRETASAADDTDSKRWLSAQSIAGAAGIASGQLAVILNGRVVGPFSSSDSLSSSDMEDLMAYELKRRLLPASATIKALHLRDKATTPLAFSRISNLIARSLVSDMPEGIFEAAPTVRTSIFKTWKSAHTAIKIGHAESASIQVVASIDPTSELAQRWVPIIKTLSELDGVHTSVFLNPRDRLEELPIKRFYRHVLVSKPTFDINGALNHVGARFTGLPADALLNIGMDIPPAWLVAPKESVHDLDNIKLSAVKSGGDIEAVYELEHILIEGHSRDLTLGPPPRGAQLVLGTDFDPHFADTIIMSNLGYFQFKANPGFYNLALQKGRSEEIFHLDSAGTNGYDAQHGDESTEIALTSFRGATLFPRLSRKPGMEEEDVLEAPKTNIENFADQADKVLAQAGVQGAQTRKYLSKAAQFGSRLLSGNLTPSASGFDEHAEINIFSVASGHLYERMLNIMMLSVMKHTNHTVKFWFIEQFLSPSFKTFLPVLAEEYGFKYEMVTYKWPHWLRSQKEKQREIWGYKILFLDVLFPLDLDKVIFVDADQIVRTDMYELVQHDLQGAPYGFTPMCDSRTEMEGFRFWKQGYWKNFLRGLPYHISALYVVDLKRFRQIAAGDRLRQQYQGLSADPNSLSNLDQDLPNHMQAALPIHSLPQDWLWCETWCSDEALKTAKTIDLCNNPQTKEPKLDRARRQVPEWTVYDDEIAAAARRHKEAEAAGRPVAGDASDAGVQGEVESIQEQLQREDAEREQRKKGNVHDEL